MEDHMSSDEEAVRAATLRFYAALEHLLCGRGTEPMKASWHHTPNVTTAHPMGDWSYGWDEILASWEAIGESGSEDAAGSSLRDLRVHVYGDVAYTTAVFVAAPKFGSVDLKVTNILHRARGEWRIVHHHADKAPAVEAVHVKMAEEKAGLA